MGATWVPPPCSTTVTLMVLGMMSAHHTVLPSHSVMHRGALSFSPGSTRVCQLAAACSALAGHARGSGSPCILITAHEEWFD